VSELFNVISSGSLKGKRLKLPSLKTTRSTKSIVKGSFFDSHRFDLRGKIFIECFGGSGVMAAEAVSNGAKMAYAVEIEKSAYEILKSNFSALSPNLRAIGGNIFTELPKILENEQESELILYLDPPFDIRDGFENIYQKTIELIENSLKFNIFLVAIEHNSDVKFPAQISDFRQIKYKKFGKTSLTYFQKA